MAKKEEAPPPPVVKELSDQDLEEIRVYADSHDVNAGAHKTELALLACSVQLLAELVRVSRQK